MRPGSLRWLCLATVLLVALPVPFAPPGVAAVEPLAPAPRLTVHGSPLIRDGERSAARDDLGAIRIVVTLPATAWLRLQVEDADGRVVAGLFDGRREAGRLVRRWRGTQERGRPVPTGPYRIVAEVGAPPESSASGSAMNVTRQGDEHLEAWVTVAERAVYAPGPGLISVAIDPGHGGSLDGAVATDGTREADLNLDIALRLARMLEGAGVAVALTRSEDALANDPPLDRTGDGLIDETDDLAARTDTANRARADLFIAIHNNIAVNRSVGGPATLYSDERSFRARSRRLARLIQDEMLAALRGLPVRDWQPYERDVLTYPYYVLRDYDPPRLLRPTQMPGVLSEGLFLSNPRELRLLQDPRVRQAMAIAYYEAIARYLERRGSHVGYELRSGPLPARPGEPVELSVEVRNQGNVPMRGWELVVTALPAPPPAIGRPRGSDVVGTRRIPNLDPGETRTLSVEVTAPASSGSWTLLVDARDRDGRRASLDGSPVLQVPLATTGSPVPLDENGAAAPVPSAAGGDTRAG